jgi:hypothetical protein
MGRKLDDPAKFLQLWTALLTVDIVWTVVVWLVQRSTSPIWARNNFAWLSVAWAFWLGSPYLLTNFGIASANHVPIMVWLIASIEIGRSITDYRANWSFYFPDGHRRA